MGIPNVSFEYGESALGGINPTVDGIAGLIVPGIAATGLALSTPKAVFSLAEVKALGIDEAYDAANSVNAYAEIKDFYSWMGDSAELWIMIVTQDTLLADICDKTKDIAKKLLLNCNGRIKIWGVAVMRSAGYVPVITDGIDADVWAGSANAQALREEMAMDYFIPTRLVLPARAWDGEAANLKDLKLSSENGVQFSMHGKAGSLEARVGFLLGLYAVLSVQRNPGRVRSGDLGLAEGTVYLTDGVNTPETIGAVQNTIHDKGYLFPIKRFGKNGYFYNDDPTATSNTDDFVSFARGRVMDKVQRLAYGAYIEFINDDYETGPDGSISPVELKRLQGDIDDLVNTEMKSAGEISGFRSLVPLEQTVAGKTKVILKVRPKAYHKEINVELGFETTSE
ncbi:MAG: DUF2586 family protein [Methylococcales bacterium]